MSETASRSSASSKADYPLCTDQASLRATPGLRSSWLSSRYDPPGTRFRIRNGVSGTNVYRTLFRVLEFSSRSEARAYIKRRALNTRIYYVEAIYDD